MSRIVQMISKILPVLSKILSNRWLQTIILILVLFSATGFAFYIWNLAPRVDQPIAFNHRVHTNDAGIECSECHSGYATGPRSGLPSSEVCMVCHSELLTENPEEKNLLEKVQGGQPVIFRKLFHLPEHVYYSHRRHVILGKLECAQCHGDIANSDKPPIRPLVQITMNFCIDCHAQAQVNNDCKSCHR